MSHNADIVRQVFTALSTWDVEAMLPYCDPELEFVSLVGQVEGTVYRGHEGLRQFVADLSEVWEVWEPVAEQVESTGDRVLALGKTRLRGKGSGVEIGIEWGQVFRFRDGRVFWSRIYSDPAEARREYEALPA